MHKKINSGTIRQILSYLGRNKKLVPVTLLLALVQVVISLRIPVLTGNAVDLAIGSGNVDFNRIAVCLVHIGICALVGAGCEWLMQAVNNRLSLNVARDIRIKAFEKISVLPTGRLDGVPHGETVSRVMADVDQLSEGVLLGLTQLITGVITIAATLVFMLMAEPVIALLVAVITPVSLFVSSFVAKHTYSMFKEQASARAELTGMINESVSGIRTIQSFGMENRTLERFDKNNGVYIDKSLKATFYSSITNPSTRFVNSLVYAVVAVSGALSCIAGNFTVGRLTCILSYASKYTKPFNEISGVVAEFQNALACAQRVFDFIDETEEAETDKHAPEKSYGHIEFRNVSFSYKKDEKLIENFSLDVKPGMKVAIVGPTGCGKTTMINLLMRFYECMSGSIVIDGADAASYTRRSMRNLFGMVLQETWLASGTIKENLLYGNPSATDEEIEAVCRKCHAHSFISRMPDGYNTYINGDSACLSAGQRQLLCIARVMLRNPSILILDEATSSIDTRTEMQIQSAFAELMKGRTTFIVAHRLSTIRSSDIIVAMNKGHIEQTGTHEELMKVGGFYRELYLSQYK